MSSRMRWSSSISRSLSATPSLSPRGMIRVQTGLSTPTWIQTWYAPHVPPQMCVLSAAQFDKVPQGLNPNATSSITYSSSNNLTDLSPVPLEFYQATDDTAFVPSIVEPQLPPADTVVDLEVTFNTMNDGTNHAMFNSITYNFPKVPTVFTQVEYATQNISAWFLSRPGR